MNTFAPLVLRSEASFAARYSREGHLGRQRPPKQSIVTVLGRKTENTYVSRILQDACLKNYNENRMTGNVLLELTDGLDQSSAEIARGYAA